LYFPTSRAIAQLRACRPIPEAEVRELCHKARELLIEEGNVVTVNAPVTVCDGLPLRAKENGAWMGANLGMRRYAAISMASSTI
jgi:hypothetical protein